MMIKYIDSHAHLTGDELYSDIPAILERAKIVGVEYIINICTDIKTAERGILLADKYPQVLNAASTTPHDVDTEGELYFSQMAEFARSNKLVAIGETGLDYHYKHSSIEKQKEYLRKYLQLALECSLPVIIHCREAFPDLFTILDSDYRLNRRHGPGILHCFTGTLQEAEEVVKRGWMLSLSGIVTFKNSHALREVAKFVPLENLLIETDAPYLAPQLRRGKINEPSFIGETAECIARVKGISTKEIAEATRLNAKAIFKI